MLGVLALVGTWMWMGAHHTSLVSQISGDWTASGVTLNVFAEEKTYEYSAISTYTRETGDLLVEGTIGGRRAGGRAAVPRFPPWGASVDAVMFGRTWTLRAEGGGQRLVLVDDSGRTTTLRRAQ
jgi:hypothetical protein